MEGRLLGLMAVGNETAEQVDHKIGRTAVARMLNLGNVLELIDDGLNDGAFADEELVREVHEAVGHLLRNSINDSLVVGKLRMVW